MHESIKNETDVATEVFLHAYKQLSDIHDEAARVSATNGIMVHLEKSGAFTRVRTQLAEQKIKEEKTLAQKLSDAGKAIEEETKKESETSVPEKTESLSDMGQAGEQKKKLLELENHLVNESNLEAEKKAEAKTFDVDEPVPQKPDGLPEYDPERKHWNYCAKHPKVGINYTSGRGQQFEYQACYKCKDFLESDGTRTPMKKVKE